MLISTLLEAALNRMLDLDPDSRDRLESLHGQVVGLEIQGLGELFLHPGKPLRLRTSAERAPAVWLRAPLSVWLGLAVGDNRPTALRVEGDGELAASLHQTLVGMQLDGEELLANWVGDVPAHLIAQRLRADGRRLGQLLETLTLNLREYLQEEGRQLPANYAVDDFMDAVDELAADTERLEARLQRLEQSMAAHNR